MQINSHFTPDSDLKSELKPNFLIHKITSKKLKLLRKRPYQVFDKSTDIT